MAISKKRKSVAAKVDKNKTYTLKDASSLVKEVNLTKFDASVDLHIRLGVDPKKADQSVRGTVSLPHGTGKTKRVLVLCTPDKEAAATAAGQLGLELQLRGPAAIAVPEGDQRIFDFVDDLKRVLPQPPLPPFATRSVSPSWARSPICSPVARSLMTVPTGTGT